MRVLPLLLIATAAASCTVGPPQAVGMTDADQARLAALTAGKVAGAPIACLPSYRSDDMRVVDENTIAFREGSSRVYVNHVQGGCPNADRPGRALVTRTVGTSLCRGDIAQVIDTASGATVGSCVFGDFVPYTRT